MMHDIAEIVSFVRPEAETLAQTVARMETIVFRRQSDGGLQQMHVRQQQLTEQLVK